MTVFKVYDLDGYFFYKVNTKDLQRACRSLFRLFGSKVRYDIV